METASAPRSILPQPGIGLRVLRAASLLVALLPGLALAQSYRNPLVNTATVTAPNDISDPTPGNNSASDSNTLAASAQLSVIKTITSPSPAPVGSTVQYRIEVRNTGPSQAVGATLTDNVPTQLTGVTWSCAAVSATTQCSTASGTGNVNVAVNVGVNEVLVVLVSGTAPATTPNTISGNSVTITPPVGTSDPTPGDNTATTPSIPVQPLALVANADDFSASPLPPGAGGTTLTVLGNDTLGGSPVVASALTTSLTNAPAGYTIASSGVISVPPTAAAGTVVVTYQICETASPSNCASANATLVVSPNAVDDSYAVQAGAALTRNVRDNDNYVLNSTFAQIGAAPTQGSVVLQSDGSFTYTANAGASGTDTFSYRLCLPGSTTVCDTATVTINITANVIDAVDDDFRASVIPTTGGSTVSVLTNDTFNGSPVVPANVSATLITQPGGYTLSGGIITVPAGAAAGPVTLTYRLCLSAAPTLCDTANVQLMIRPDAVDDTVQTPGAGVAATGNVGSNDNAPAGSTFTLTTQATQGTATISPTGAFTYTPNPTAFGSDSFGYRVCLPAPNGAVCDDAVVNVTLGANVLVANDDSFATPVSPGSGGSTTTVLGNDTFNGATVVPGTVTATLTAAVGGFTLNASSGVITVAPGTPAGAASLSYQICEVANLANCSAAANVQVLVSPLAVADSFNVQSGATYTGDVGSNDNAPADALFAVIGQPQRGTLTLSPTGSFSYVAATGSTGADSFDYQVCLPAPHATVCSVATVSVTIAANVLDAQDDDFTATVILPTTGGATLSVLGNDTFNGQPVAAAQVTVSLQGTPPPGYTITPAGIINVPAGAAAGLVNLTYELCEVGAVADCDTAQVALLVAPLAVADSYSTPAGQPLSGNVGLNDNAPVGAVFSVQTPPAAGSFVLDTDGTFTFTPAGAGAQTAQYQVCLPAPNNTVCSLASVSFDVVTNTVLAVDDDFRSPVFAPGAGGTTGSVLGNDLFNGNPVTPLQVTANLVSSPVGFSIDGSGVITATSYAAAGAHTLVYSLCELGSTSNCDSADVLVLVSPDAVDDAVSTPLGQVLNGNVAGNDNVPVGAVFSLVAPATSGSATVNPDGSFIYTPAGNGTGSATFGYRVCLPGPDSAICDTATVTVTIAANALVAVDDDFRSSVFAPGAGGTTPSVLVNDTINGELVVAGDVTVSLVGAPAGYAIDAAGVITVQATAAAGAQTLTYQICDALDISVCDTASVQLLISPFAQDDSFSTTVNVPINGSVALNDNVPVGATFTTTIPATSGQAVLDGSGTFTYTPGAAFTGTDSFTYQVCLPAPDAAVCDTGVVTFTVGTISLQAVSDDFTASPINPVTGGSTASVLLNDSFNGAPIVPGTTAVTASLVTPVPGYTMAADGVVTVAAGTTPAAVILQYQLCENVAPTNCATSTALVAVSPSAVADTLNAAAGTTIVLDVLANDTVPVNPVVTISVVPTNGIAVVNPDGSISYTPNTGYTGSDSFTYQVCLPAPYNTVCDTATVSLTVSNTTLVAVADDFTATPIDPAVGGATPSVLLNDTFNSLPIVPGTTAVTASLVTPVPGYTMAADGVVTVAPGTTPAAVTLQYQVCENAVPGNCANASAVVAVSPSAVADTLNAAAGTTTVLDVLANDTVPVNPVVTLPVPPTNGTAVVNPNGTISYTPNTGYTGSDSFTYQVCLPAPYNTVCDTATVSLTVSNTTLVAVADDFTATPIDPAVGGATPSVLLNDTFNSLPIVPGTTAVTASLVTPVPGYTMAADGVVTVAPGTAPAAVTLQYQVCENAVPGNCANATAVVAVSPNAVADTLNAAAGTTTVLDVLANDTVPLNPVVTVLVQAGNGLAVVNPNGTISYTPNAGYTGSDSFTYQVCLPAPYNTVCDTATVSLTVSNTTLVAVADDFTATPIDPAVGGATPSVLLNDTFNSLPIVPGTTAVTASLVTPVPGYTMAADGVVTVAAGTTPAAVTLQYQVCENAVPGNCANATAVVAVSPSAVADTLNAAAGSTTVLDVLANDTVPLNPVVTVSVPPTSGTAVVNPDGTISYTPNTGYTGSDSFTYQVCLPAPYNTVCDTATVSLTVSNTTLVAVADDFTATPIDPAVGGATPSVLLNDTFNSLPIVPGTTAVTASLVAPVPGYTMAADGVVTVAAGTTPAAVTLQYQVCENAVPGNCANATAVVAVSPSAVADTLNAAAGTTTVLDVLANDTLPLNPVVTVLVQAGNGLAVVNPNGTISYTPNAGYTGSDSFTYQVCLPAPYNTVCDTATVSLTVSNTTLVAVADDFTATPIDPATGGSTVSVLLNDTFNSLPIVPGTTAVTASLVTAVPGYTMAADGVVTVAPGTTPAAVTLQYQVCENAVPGNCANATAVVAVSPSAVADTLNAAAGTTTVLDVLANDTVPLNPVVTLPVPPTNGTAVVNPNGTVSYTPNAGYTGSDSFTYQVCLPAPYNTVCDTATVSLTVSNTTLVAVADDFTATPIDPAVGGTTPSVLLNDTFNSLPIVPGTTAVTASLVTPVPGYTMAADGVVTVAPGTTPAAVTLQYQVCENAVPGNCANATAVVAVSPSAVADTLNAAAGTTTVLDVLANDTVPVNPVVTIPVPPTNGTAVVNPDGTISYTPNTGFTGTDSFIYQLCLPAPYAGICDTATLTVTVTAGAATIVAVNDDFRSAPLAPGGGSTASVLLNDSYNGAAIVPGTTPVTASLVSAVPGYAIDANGVITLQASVPPSVQTLQYQACENAVPGNCMPAEVVVAVRPNAVNDTQPAASGIATAINVLANDIAPVNPVVSISVAPGNGTAVLNADNTITYTSNAGYTGSDSLTYQLCLPAPDSTVCHTAVVSITVSAGAPLLLAMDDNFSSTPTAPGAGGSTASVLTNDTLGGTPVQVGQVTLSLVNPPAGFSIANSGVISIAGSAQAGAVTLTYEACQTDDSSNCDTADVLVVISPDAVNDSATANNGQPVSGNVGSNDNTGSAAVFSLQTAPQRGSVLFNGDGSFTYTPNAGQSGSDVFTYRVCLPSPYAAVCDTATVSIDLGVAAVTLDAVDDGATEVPVTGAQGVLNVLVNDTLDGAAFDPTLVVLTPTNTSVLTIQPNGSLDVGPGVAAATYTTTYRICLVADTSVCDIGTVTVTMSSTSAQVPVEAAADASSTPQDTATVIAVLLNDRVNGQPVDAATVTLAINVAPVNGTAELLSDGTVRYTPAASFSGPDNFTYTLCRPASGSTPESCASAVVTVQVLPNVISVVDETISAPEGEPVSINLLDNVSTTGAPINWGSLRLLREPANGRVVCDSNGRCVYTSLAGYVGPDNFIYSICDNSVPVPFCAEGVVDVSVVAQQTVLRLTKQSLQRTAQIGDLVRYVVTVENMGSTDALAVTLLDTLPAGFTYVAQGLEIRDQDNAGFVSATSPLRIEGIDVPGNGQATVVYYLRVGAGVGQGIHTNRVTAVDVAGASIGNVAGADVEVVGDPLLDESLIIGSVFDDRNGNGIQDPGERGIPGVRVASVEGLVMETDAYGRYHLLGINGGAVRGRNFILKVDPATLPGEATFTTPNPLLRRITPGLPVRFDFGVHLPEGRFTTSAPTGVTLDLGQALFAPGTAELAQGHAAVLAHAAQLLEQRGGGQVRVAVPGDQPALAALRVEAVRTRLLALLPAAMAGQVQVFAEPSVSPPAANRADR